MANRHRGDVEIKLGDAIYVARFNLEKVQEVCDALGFKAFSDFNTNDLSPKQLATFLKIALSFHHSSDRNVMDPGWIMQQDFNVVDTVKRAIQALSIAMNGPEDVVIPPINPDGDDVELSEEELKN